MLYGHRWDYLDLDEKIEMRRLLAMLFFGLLLWAAKFPLAPFVDVHVYYDLMVIFFIIQNVVLFRIENMATADQKVQIRLVNIGVRLLSALAFLVVTFWIMNITERSFYIQFVILYLVFMTFEIILSLANLRRN